MTLTFVRIRKKISKNGSLTPRRWCRTVKIWHTLIIRSDFSKDDHARPFCIRHQFSWLQNWCYSRVSRFVLSQSINMLSIKLRYIRKKFSYKINYQIIKYQLYLYYQINKFSNKYNINLFFWNYNVHCYNIHQLTSLERKIAHTVN